MSYSRRRYGGVAINESVENEGKYVEFLEEVRDEGKLLHLKGKSLYLYSIERLVEAYLDNKLSKSFFNYALGQTIDSIGPTLQVLRGGIKKSNNRTKRKTTRRRINRKY